MFCFQCEQTEGKGINIYTHGEIDEKKDFTPVIEKALELEEIGGLPAQLSPVCVRLSLWFFLL